MESYESLLKAEVKAAAEKPPAPPPSQAPAPAPASVPAQGLASAPAPAPAPPRPAAARKAPAILEGGWRQRINSIPVDDEDGPPPLANAPEEAIPVAQGYGGGKRFRKQGSERALEPLVVLTMEKVSTNIEANGPDADDVPENNDDLFDTALANFGAARGGGGRQTKAPRR